MPNHLAERMAAFDWDSMQQTLDEQGTQPFRLYWSWCQHRKFEYEI